MILSLDKTARYLYLDARIFVLAGKRNIASVFGARNLSLLPASNTDSGLFLSSVSSPGAVPHQAKKDNLSSGGRSNKIQALATTGNLDLERRESVNAGNGGCGWHPTKTTTAGRGRAMPAQGEAPLPLRGVGRFIGKSELSTRNAGLLGQHPCKSQSGLKYKVQGEK